MISQDIINQIIEQVDIVDVIGSYLSLTPKGKNYLAVCPFHNDTNPSMSISREKKYFKCFSCGTGGNVIQFVQKYEHISFQDAVVKLATRIGINIEVYNDPESRQRQKYYLAMNETINFYQFYLNNTAEGLKAKNYLNSRDISQEIIDKFQIGLAPSADNYLYLALNEKQVGIIEQIDLGLVREKSQGDYYDAFRNRIIFPIADNVGQVVGLSGRIFLPNDKNSKYLNSQENVIFHKGEILYNYHLASLSARKFDAIYIFEGFMDVIAAEKAGITNGVATMGTSLTRFHIKSLLSLTKNIILCFDGDAAGINATKKAAELFSSFNVLPYAVALPEGLDPDEYLQKYGKVALNEYLSTNRLNIYEYLYKTAKTNLIVEDLSSIEQFKNNIFDIIRKAKSQTISEFYIKKMSVDLDTDINTLITDFGSMVAPITSPKVEKTSDIIQEEVVKPKIYQALKTIIKSSFKSKEVMIKYFQRTKNNYIPNTMPYFSLINEIYLEYNVDGLATYEKVKQNLQADETSISCLDEIMNNRLIEDNNIEGWMECIDTIVDYWQENEKKACYKKALLDDKHCRELIEVARKRQKLK